jgi:hypothetical protein
MLLLKRKSPEFVPEMIAEALASELGRNIPPPSCGQEFNSNRAAYTKEVFRIVAALGRQHGLQTITDTNCEYTTYSPRCGFDLCWARARTKLMVLESEWFYREDLIAEDFQKLIRADVPLKIMLHWRQRDEHLAAMLSKMINDARGTGVYGLIKVTDFKGCMFLRTWPSTEPGPRTHAISFSDPKMFCWNANWDDINRERNLPKNNVERVAEMCDLDVLSDRVQANGVWVRVYGLGYDSTESDPKKLWSTPMFEDPSDLEAFCTYHLSDFGRNVAANKKPPDAIEWLIPKRNT